MIKTEIENSNAGITFCLKGSFKNAEEWFMDCKMTVTTFLLTNTENKKVIKNYDTARHNG